MLAALSLNAVALVVGILALLAFAVGLGWSLWRKTRVRPYLAHAEYWVYLPGDQLPSQDKILDRMMIKNPHRVAGKMPITKDEALLFSDVRLHIALVLRAKNPHVFRPDLFNEHAEPTQEVLEGLAESHAFVKVRFISEEPLKDLRHLRFLAHAADAIADIGDGVVIYDTVAERLFTAKQFSDEIDRVGDASDADFQTQVVWDRSQSGGSAQTRGLVKVGLPELATEPMNADQEVLVTAILEGVIREVWRSSSLPESIDISYFDDPYRVETRQARKGPARAVLMRLPG